MLLHWPVYICKISIKSPNSALLLPREGLHLSRPLDTFPVTLTSGSSLCHCMVSPCPGDGALNIIQVTATCECRDQVPTAGSSLQQCCTFKQKRDANALSLGLLCIANFVCWIADKMLLFGCEPALKTGCLIWSYVIWHISDYISITCNVSDPYRKSLNTDQTCNKGFKKHSDPTLWKASMGIVAMVNPHFQQIFLSTSVFITLALVKLLTEEKRPLP